MNISHIEREPNNAIDLLLASPHLEQSEAKKEAIVMGILNLTPDSFYPHSRITASNALVKRATEMVQEGAAVLDLGGYSTRPGAAEVDTTEEWNRLRPALELLRSELPTVPLSIDTFRAEIAQRCIETFGVEMINDISGGEADSRMFPLVAQSNVWYVLMHSKGTPQVMQQLTQYQNLTHDIVEWLAHRAEQLRILGCRRVAIDPGFGFAKTTEQNYQLLAELNRFEPLGCPLLVGISRKSMIWRLLNITPNESLNGTTVLHTIGLLNGAAILRAHDVKEAVETIKICHTLKNSLSAHAPNQAEG